MLLAIKRRLLAPVLYSYGRRVIDEQMQMHSHLIQNPAIDIGGGRLRGCFRYGEVRPKIIDIVDGPHVDLVADAHDLPLKDASIRTVILNNTLEHVANPFQVISEVNRVMKPGGVLLVAIPFLRPIHADPDDYTRFTRSGLRHLLAEYFVDIEIYPVGGLGLLVVETIRDQVMKTRWWLRYLCYLFLLPIGEYLYQTARDPEAKENPPYTTGYFVVAQKPKR